MNKGDKPLRISWYFHSTELTSSQTGVYTSSMGDRSNILSIPSTGISNGGNYTCVAQNAVGMDYYSAFLEVNGITIHFNIHFAYRILLRFNDGMTALIVCSSMENLQNFLFILHIKFIHNVLIIILYYLN